jgi:hypothetical protein
LGRELALPARADAEQRRGHDAGVVDEEVDGPVEALGEGADGVLVVELELVDVDVLDGCELGARVVGAARRDDDARARVDQRARGLYAPRPSSRR